jgi:alkylation response protein AidB-like acyl-CoA dehydrogenase
MTYTAPLKDMLFVMNELAGLNEVAQLPGYEEAAAETAGAVLEENARFVQEIIAPLNRVGDTQPPSYESGAVKTSPGFKQAFKQFAAAGWQGVQHPTEFGGGGLPKLIATACTEMLNAGNLSFALCPLLTDGAIEALMTAGTPEQQQRYVAKLIDGSWTGTMNLTEPQAGSDLSLVRTKAVKQADNSYRLFGQKIYITYGEHDMADNIIHMVLARTPEAPEGVKGLSLFIVPKILEDGTRNDVFCASLEHKLGIKASPTAVLLYGDGKYPVNGQPGAVGYLMGEENRGLEYMFIMMNAARFAVGMQGIGVAERAYQKAVQYARDRVQSRDLSGSEGPVAIIHHPDVKRMLLFMRANTEAARALAYWAAAQCDLSLHHPDPIKRQQARIFYEYCVPIVKGFSTEMAVEVCSTGVQVHGGMGFIEETGAAQYYRDARILTIYEGTTAIQANDLVSRKTARDAGAGVKALAALIEATEQQLLLHSAKPMVDMAHQLSQARQALLSATDYIVRNVRQDPKAVFSGSVPYLKLAGLTLGGWQMACAMLRVSGTGNRLDADFCNTKIATAHYYAQHLLTHTLVLERTIMTGGYSVVFFESANF